MTLVLVMALLPVCYVTVLCDGLFHLKGPRFLPSRNLTQQENGRVCP